MLNVEKTLDVYIILIDLAIFNDTSINVYIGGQGNTEKLLEEVKTENLVPNSLELASEPKEHLCMSLFIGVNSVINTCFQVINGKTPPYEISENFVKAASSKFNQS